MDARLRQVFGPLRTCAALVLSALLALSFASCARSAPNEVAAPEAAFEGVRRALMAQDHASLWSFLGPQTRSGLEARAAEAESAGVAVEHPAALLVVAWVPNAADIEQLERVEESDTQVTLRVTTALGASNNVTLLRGESGWRVELDLAGAAPE